MAEVLTTIAGWIGKGRQHYVCVTGVHGVMESQRDPALMEIHNRSGLTVPDGMPLVWAGWAAGAPWMDRVYGPDLMLAVCERAVEEGWTSYLFGGKEGVADLLAERFQERFPGLQIVGTHSPPFRSPTPQEDEAALAAINTANPDIVWVGLSTPKQERWMADHIDRLDARVLVGVGAAFDFHAGLVPQAPRFLHRTGLEWAYRLVQEPRRLGPRYLRSHPRFVVAVARRRPRMRP